MYFSSSELFVFSLVYIEKKIDYIYKAKPENGL